MAGSETFKDAQTLESYSAFSCHTIRYQFEDGSFGDVIQTPAWCSDCNTVVSAEHIESEEEKQRERKEIDDFINGRPTNSIFEFFASEMPEPSVYLAQREEYWSRFENRQQPATCLDCHGTNISKLDCSGETPTQIPDGPTLWHTGTSMADVWPIPIMTIDIDGKLISKQMSK